MELGTADADSLGLADDDMKEFVSRRGRLEANWLTIDAVDPWIGTPEYKVCAVRAERA